MLLIGFRVWDLGCAFGVWDVGFTVIRAQNLEFGVKG